MARKAKFTMTAADKRRLERAVAAQVEKKITPEVVQSRREEIAATLNAMVPELQGQPVEDVKEAVVSRLGGIGVTITDPELTQYAEEIAQGGSFNA
ncbi:hypothetical protein ACIQUW_33255 [Streptomyces sp. NPDC101117]|uniref:hypothetical protein n=1 Tax=Streptomyces sp. NPDC101117 TaxID=3366108 RepID=UPI0037F92942